MTGIEIISAALLVGLAVTGIFIIAILTQERENTLREFAVLGLFCSSLILLSYYMELNSPGYSAKLSAVKFGYIGRAFVNPLLLMLVLRYYHVRENRLLYAALFVIPAAVICAVFSCEQFPIYYRDIALLPSGLLSIRPGPLYYLYMAYNTLMALVVVTVCLYQRASLYGRDKFNNTLLILACIVPLFSLLVYLSGWTAGYDITVLGVLFGNLLIALSILRYGLLNKDEILRNMATGLIFLDSDARLVYANRAAEQILPALRSAPVRSHKQDLSQLCTPEFSAIQVGSATYQRKITEWSNGDGAHGMLLTFDDITEIRARLNRDAMTGLYNHASFYPMLDEALGDAGRSRSLVTVSIADIDSFKRINDNYGHANGDIILIALADTLREICGLHGDVFRYGGEEFAVIFYGGYDLAESVMQQALSAFAAMDFDFLPYHATFSFGSAEFDGLENSVTLFDRADQLMYTRKKALHARERSGR